MEIISYWIGEIALLVSGFLYMRTIEKREKFLLRIIVNTVIFWGLAGVITLVFQVQRLWVGNVLWLVFLLYMAYFLYAGWMLTKRAAVYYAVWALLTWQLWYGLWLFLAESNKMIWERQPILVQLLQLLVFGIGYSIFAGTICKWMPEGGRKKIGPRQFLLSLLIVVAFEAVSLMTRNIGIKVASAQWAIMYLIQVLLVMILYLQNELFKKSSMRQELELLNLLWKKEQEQYELSRENIALINQKCHDLKHQIRAIRSAGQDEMQQYLKEMEDSIHIYEAIVKTGNEVLDTILTEKSLYCKERGITVSCVADGSQMAFINTVDLYAILGNAIDNAIEAVENFKQEEERQIDVLIYRQQEILMMNVINPIKKSLVYEEELPVTTKGDKNYHGYGLKSIRYLVKKYDGYVNINEEDGCFSLMMLIPIPKEKTR